MSLNDPHEPPVNRPALPSGRVRVSEGDGRLEFRTTPISIPGGLVMLAFAAGFVGLAIRGTPPDVGDGLSSIGMVVLALGLTVPAGWVLSHQRLALSADGVVATRSVFGVPIRRRRVPLHKVGPARCRFSHAGGDESPDVYVLEVGAAPRPVRFGGGCGEAELKGLADRFNAFKQGLGRGAGPT